MILKLLSTVLNVYIFINILTGKNNIEYLDRHIDRIYLQYSILRVNRILAAAHGLFEHIAILLLHVYA